MRKWEYMTLHVETEVYGFTGNRMVFVANFPSGERKMYRFTEANDEKPVNDEDKEKFRVQTFNTLGKDRWECITFTGEQYILKRPIEE